VTSEEILKEDLQTFNWNEVDEYPTFSSCDPSLTKSQRKACFETTLIEHITSKLVQSKIVVTKDLNDTINITFLISETGNLTVLKIKKSEQVKIQIPEIDELLKQSLEGLPEILPAHKQGQLVKTEFKLPVVIKVS